MCVEGKKLFRLELIRIMTIHECTGFNAQANLKMRINFSVRR